MLFTFLTLFIWRSHSDSMRSRMEMSQSPLKSVKLPFELQSDLCPCPSLTSRKTVKYQHHFFAIKKTRSPSLSKAHRWRSRYGPCHICAPRAGSLSLCFQLSLQNPPAHTCSIPPYKQLKVWNTLGLSHPRNSKKGQNNCNLCPRL